MILGFAREGWLDRAASYAAHLFSKPISIEPSKRWCNFPNSFCPRIGRTHTPPAVALSSGWGALLLLRSPSGGRLGLGGTHGLPLHFYSLPILQEKNRTLNLYLVRTHCKAGRVCGKLPCTKVLRAYSHHCTVLRSQAFAARTRLLLAEIFSVSALFRGVNERT